MMVKLDSFSIREYVSKTRTVDVAKCWPFSKGDQMKFRWWSHELELSRLRDEDTVQTQSTLDITNLHQSNIIARNESDRLVAERSDLVSASPECADVRISSGNMPVVKKERMKKGKRAKAPKKRSILEICAVAPQIQNVAEGESVKLMKKKSKLKKEKLKKKIFKKTASIQNKDKYQKLKQPAAVNFNRLYSLSCNKKFSDVIFGSIDKNKSNRKCEPTKKKHKAIPTSLLVEKLQKPVTPTRGILKNQTIVSLEKNPSRICDLQRAHDEIPCGSELSERHVRFSGKDDILGPRRKHVSSIEGPISQSRSKSSLDTIAASSDKVRCLKSNEDLCATEVSGSDEDVSFDSDDRFEIQPFNQSDSREHFRMRSMSRPLSGRREIVDNLYKSVSENQDGLNGGYFPNFDQGNPTIPDKSSHDITSRVHLPLNERYNSVVTNHNSNVSGDSSTWEEIIGRTCCPTRVVPATSSVSYMKELPQPSSLCLDINGTTNESVASLPQTTNGNYNLYPPEYQQFNHLSQKELMGSLSSFPKQNVVMFGGNSRDDNNFFGLPLNSQGELIPLKSSGKGGFNQPKKTCMVACSSGLSPMCNHVIPEVTADCLNVNEGHTIERGLQKDHFRLANFHNHVKENPNCFASSRLSVSDLPCNRNTDHQCLRYKRSSEYLCPWESELTLIDSSFRGRNYEQFPNRVGTGQAQLHEGPRQMLSHMTQPTMRLMGKDVTVGSSKDSQGVENGKVWTDKEIIKEHRPISTFTDNSVVNRDFCLDSVSLSPMEKSKDYLPHSIDVRNSEVSQRVLQVQAPDCRIHYSYSHPSWQTNALSENSSPLDINGTLSSNMQAFIRTPFPTMSNRVPNLMSEIGSFKISSQIPAPQSYPLNTCQHMHLNSAEVKYKQSVPHATKSVFQFPFLYPDYRAAVEPSWFREPSKSLPPWLLHASLGKETVFTSSQPYSCTDRTNFPLIPSVPHAPVDSYPYNHGITHHCHMKNSFGSASLTHPSLVPIPGYKPSDKNAGFRNKSKLKVPARKLDTFNKTRKRLAMKLDDSRRLPKIPNLGRQDGVNALKGPNGWGDFTGERQCAAGTAELGQNRDGSSIVRCNLKNTYKGNLGPSLGIDNSKSDCIMKSPGPHKLSAGVKHIIQPGQSIDQDNTVPTHSTIPFPVSNNFGRIPESQKPAKIYRL